MRANNPPEDFATRIAQQIAVCDGVLARLAALDDRNVESLMEDVRRLRASLQTKLASMDGDGSAPTL